MIIAKIKNLFDQIDSTLFTIEPVFNYLETIEAITKMANLVHKYEPIDGDNSQLWAIGEHSIASIDPLLVGAYWFCVHYHNGQDSIEYACQCAIGRMYSPGPATKGPEAESGEMETYTALETLLKESMQ